MSKYQKYHIGLIASTLAKTLDTETVTKIVDSLLTCDDNDRLSDAEAVVGGELFDMLLELVPEAAFQDASFEESPEQCPPTN